MDHHFLPHHTSHTPQMSHPSSQHGQHSQHQQPLTRPPFAEQNSSTQQQQPQQGHAQGSQAQAQQGQGQQPPQIRSRITVVCAECKRLKLRCDRRAPCGSCTKRDTVQRCIYSPAAAEKVDLHSLNNRLIQVEAMFTMMTSGQFESVYPGARELVDNVRGMGGLASATGTAGSSGQAGCVGPHGISTQIQGGRGEGYREQQGQSGLQEPNTQLIGDNDNELHRFPHQHAHQHHHHRGTAPSQTYSASSSFKTLARECARAIDTSSISGTNCAAGQTQQGTTVDNTNGQTQLIKLEPSPSDLGFSGSRSPSPIPFFAPTAQSTSTSNTTIPSSIYTSMSTTTPPIHLPALSIYYPLPTILPPGATEPEGIVPPFSGLTSGGGSFSSIPTHTASPSEPQVTSALLALLPTGEKCLRWLELAEKVVNIRGLPLEVEAPRNSQQENASDQVSEKAAWESFEERCWPLIGAQGKTRSAEVEKKERARNRERERRRERDRDKPPGSSASAPTSPGGPEKEKDRSLKELEREKARRARQIYFGGLATAPGGSIVPPGIPRRRAVDEYREREGLSPSPESAGGARNEHRTHTPPPFRAVVRRERPASVPFHQALSSPKKDESLTFFALMCTILAMGGIIERSQLAKHTRSEDSSAPTSSSSSPTSILPSTDASSSPEFLYALGRQALGVWDTQISSSSSSYLSKPCLRERQRLEYILTCSVAANYVLLGLELGLRPDRDGMFDGSDYAEGEGCGLSGEGDHSRVPGCSYEEEERMHEETSRRKAGRIIYGLVGKMVNAGRAMGLAHDPDLRSQVLKQESESSSSTVAKLGRDEWKRAVWWEIVFWDLFVADVFNHQPYISAGSYTTRLPGTSFPSQHESEAATNTDQGHSASSQQKSMSAEYMIARYRLTSITQGLQARLARPDCCCGYTLDQASSIEADVRTFLSELPDPLKVSSHGRKFDSDSLATQHQPDYSLRQMQAYELAIVANTLLLGIYAPFISSSSNTSNASARPPYTFGSTFFPSTGGKSVIDVGSSHPAGLANKGNDSHANSHNALTLQPTSNAISAASAKSGSNVIQNDSNLGGHQGSGASVNFAGTTYLHSANNGLSGTHVDANASSGPAPSGALGLDATSQMALTWTTADSVTLGSAGSGLSRRGREVEVVDGNSSGVIDMPRLGDRNVNALAIHASVRAAKSIVRLFEGLRDTIIDIKCVSSTPLVVPALFVFYPPPTTLLNTLLVLARAQGDFCLPSKNSWSGIADPQDLLNDVETALSIIDRGNFWVDRLSKDDQGILDQIRKKSSDIRSGLSLDISTQLTVDAMVRFNAEEESDAAEALGASGIQHMPHGLKRKHSQVSVGPDAVNGSGARLFDHEFTLNDGNITSLPNSSGVNGSAGGRGGEVLMDGLTGSTSEPSYDFGAMARHQGAQSSLLESQVQPSLAPSQSDFVQSEQMRQSHYLEPQHKLTNDQPIAQQQHHPFTSELGVPIQRYSQVRQKSPEPQNYSYVEQHVSRPQETLADRITEKRRDMIQEQLQREREKRAAADYKERKSSSGSSGSSSSRKSVLPAIGIRLRVNKDGQAITGNSHMANNGKGYDEDGTPIVMSYPQRKLQEDGAYRHPQACDGNMTAPPSPVMGFRSRSASVNQPQMQMQYEQQQTSTLQQQEEMASQQHNVDFSSMAMSHGLPLSSPTDDYGMEPMQKKTYETMHVSERGAPAQPQPSFGSQPSSFSHQSYDQNANQGIHSVFTSPQPMSQYERPVENHASVNMMYHSSTSPYANASGSGSGSPFQINNSSGHPTPTFPSHHPTPPIFGAAAPPVPPSTNHPSPVNFFHNQFSGHESVSYANSPVSSTNITHHQPQPMHSQRNALMDMQLDRIEHSNMMASIPGTPVYEKSQLQPMDSYENKASVVMSEMHGMAHSMSEQMDMSGHMGAGAVWGNRGPAPSAMSVEHHHHQQQQQQQLHQRHPQDMATQAAFWSNNSELKFFQ